VECRHADVDRDDRFCSICQWEWRFTCRDAFGGLVGLDYLREFLGPFALCCIQAFVQIVKDGVIADLSLTITLRIVGSEEPVGDLILRIKVSYLLAGKVYLAVGIMVWGVRSDT